jgi:Ner family transcriptional regulator
MDRFAIIAELGRRGMSLASLAISNGYHRTHSASVPARWPKVQQIVAEAIGRLPEELWPERYRDHHTPSSARPNENVNQGGIR